MSRIPATLIVLVVLGASRAAGQTDEPHDAVEPAARRPAGRRLLDEAARERQRGRAAPAAEDPLLAPVPNPMRPLERLPDAEPAAPPA
ncbi:MAG: hypothetical protein JNG90_00880, partial [Planctomycetaceae bacterium]|nr:hypothetical protein [Planctomycetaceae bacterium]